MYNAQPHPRCKNTSARRPAAMKAACLPCRRRKIRCQGQVSPCGTCVSRKIEGKCAFSAQETVSVPEQASQVIRNDFDGKMPEEDQTWDTTDNTSTLSDLSSTPSLSVGATDDESDTRTARAGTIFEPSLQALPSWQMMEDLKRRYFTYVSPTEFEEEFLIFHQHPAVTPLAWRSLLFVVLALACLTEERPESIRSYRLLSMRYDRIACNSLSIDNPPFQPSVTAWKAMVLLIYGRLHRGENVSEDLRSAYNMANTIGCDSCCRQSLECETHGILWIGLEMLCSMNRQAFGNTCEHESPPKERVFG
ncbi:hypothetical protein N7450_011414 [Penicillium hetheringtonii]|uniref:Zn(2)-C6 fungal-type domain-containing protein n=1 Tax=Penicillium hetheringtonii TaxID=911720 RepID=A0AAD6DA80_9EURO|nr:hypothetical protein N7450_011414 [Penicillium hetheringtonii]